MYRRLGPQADEGCNLFITHYYGDVFLLLMGRGVHSASMFHTKSCLHAASLI